MIYTPPDVCEELSFKCSLTLAFSYQTDGSGRLVLTKGRKAPQVFCPICSFLRYKLSLQFNTFQTLFVQKCPSPSLTYFTDFFTSLFGTETASKRAVFYHVFKVQDAVLLCFSFTILSWVILAIFNIVH